MDITKLTIHELRDMLRKGEISSEEIVKAYFDRIEETEAKLNSFISLNKEEAIKSAREIDKRLKNGEKLGDLAGIPVAIKDNIVTEGVKTTCGSKILENFVPPYDATVVKKLKDEGAIIVGKTNLDEFAMGSSTENSAYKTTKNPWDLERVPGGSSGGSASAVAAGQVPFALGSETGGSVRQPASFCGVVGLKPTYGLVSRYGLVAFASSLDQIGPFTKDVEDCAIALNSITGYDSKDSTSINREKIDYKEALVNDVKGLKIALPKEYFDDSIDAEVKNKVYEAIKVLEDLGATVEEVSLPHTEYALATYYIIAPSEASSNLARFDGVRYGNRVKDYDSVEDLFVKTRSQGFGEEVKRRIMVGTYALSSGYYDEYYRKAQRVRTLIKQDFEKVFENYDVIISPTTPTTAFKIGEKATDPVSMYLSDILTVSVNMAGICGMSIPCGYANDLPVGLQIIGNAFEEKKVLRVAYTYEQNSNFERKQPKIGE
ncbi:Asp-tRNA(Asn)/Glu-tRNA(Gln) amidotransferase subunit GatA [Caldisalinibacter kiritimatiensis]|uniref:Glutamyl-tRNA(Gln) amidotransferase subunit A n=1 Tax=Caldisalinibacter kiritimatiensis TaxID=1304284 RepID=R1CUF3_9FIRM|nr:Asp-tRNA(Asn)/Glu-tRNA(Gln) amidotransferase subunit GatA [Caldisalinibacter kiritimatiensis]EOD00304.1 Aspartyl-tRNA(Asn) amidotransferase subunit A / Glutamyl-tRNA(Gln) amidotransferase subunit A [Caldisalinibacter kiritimatiensis]